MSTDVLIVGAGPVGLVMAAELARYGVKVRIVEKTAHGSNQPKALFLWSRTLELLDRAGCGAAIRHTRRLLPISELLCPQLPAGAAMPPTPAAPVRHLCCERALMPPCLP